MHNHQEGGERRYSGYGQYSLLEGEEYLIKTKCKYIYTNEVTTEGEFFVTNFRVIFKPPSDFMQREYIIYDYFHIPLMMINK